MSSEEWTTPEHANRYLALADSVPRRAEDRLLDVETQLRWLREHGFDDVDCYWKWLEMALLVGVKPALGDTA